MTDVAIVWRYGGDTNIRRTFEGTGSVRRHVIVLVPIYAG